VRLVTTNFDLLFEAAAPKATVWTPARLPQTREIASFEGIVHLHGVFDNAYQEPVGGSFVLSSAEFGRAYLAEGWATAFIRSVMDNYRIVFVGYAADDPPVQYLLEALRRHLALAGLHQRRGECRPAVQTLGTCPSQPRQTRTLPQQPIRDGIALSFDPQAQRQSTDGPHLGPWPPMHKATAAYTPSTGETLDTFGAYATELLRAAL
jgi:hypothetical protein